MEIKHEPFLDIAKVEKLYSEKDGVDVKYVCTTDIKQSDSPIDVFYRETPHPEFGNRYFGLFYDNYVGRLFILNADSVEDLDFGMIEHEGVYYYSKSHHDCKVVGDKMIDGGREYIRSGDHPVIPMKVKDGNFVVQTVDSVV